jgi:hypothetical protein
MLYFRSILVFRGVSTGHMTITASVWTSKGYLNDYVSIFWYFLTTLDALLKQNLYSQRDIKKQPRWWSSQQKSFVELWTKRIIFATCPLLLMLTMVCAQLSVLWLVAFSSLFSMSMLFIINYMVCLIWSLYHIVLLPPSCKYQFCWSCAMALITMADYLFDVYFHEVKNSYLLICYIWRRAINFSGECLPSGLLYEQITLHCSTS